MVAKTAAPAKKTAAMTAKATIAMTKIAPTPNKTTPAGWSIAQRNAALPAYADIALGLPSPTMLLVAGTVGCANVAPQ